jgi:hypothetical protein
LDALCKIYKRNKKAEKEKKKEEKKIYKRARGNESAQLQIRPVAQEAEPEPIPSSLSRPRLQAGPTSQPGLLPPRVNHADDGFLRAVTPFPI